MMKPALFGVLLLLAGCAGKPVAEVAFPDAIGDFTRDPSAASGQSAAYTMDADDPVTATVRIGSPHRGSTLIPALDLNPEGVDAAIAIDDRGIKRFYPNAKLLLDEPLYLIRNGALAEGRHQTWQYQDAFLGGIRLMNTDVVINCCSDQQQLISVWFRHRADRPIGPEMLGFLNNLPWN